MKIQNKTVFPLIAVFTVVVTLAIQPAFAENVPVSIPAGSSVPGCETTSECFIPDKVTVTVGDEVTWKNDDTAAHTVTSGSAANGPSGVFDSSLFMAGTTFSHKFDATGKFPYFCMVHPWMNGMVTVLEKGASNMTKPVEGAPLKQTQKGVSPKDISCKTGMQLVFNHNGDPACVKMSSVKKLAQRGWTS